MSEHKHDQETAEEQGERGGGTVSEGGSGALNADTSHGGADSVPDTPDVNTEITDDVDANEHSQEDGGQNPL
ncbi:hypothetical protein [Ornithinimicrobium pratense]|uniref:Uncharacterized protein n=1 Tax=Ornithinimicrobium pratense TaxID=2593973 RepID=A0A5J6V666_9MICO|nr:hypothetical protein [Ornithinimicrobium pratense]QFG68532.1 hypothetical protein FY030_07205 [Ornithinimicrobium pratense]